MVYPSIPKAVILTVLPGKAVSRRNETVFCRRLDLAWHALSYCSTHVVLQQHLGRIFFSCHSHTRTISASVAPCPWQSTTDISIGWGEPTTNAQHFGFQAHEQTRKLGSKDPLAIQAETHSQQPATTEIWVLQLEPIAHINTRLWPANQPKLCTLQEPQVTSLRV